MVLENQVTGFGV